MNKKYTYILLIGISGFLSLLSLGSFISTDRQMGSSSEEINLAIRNAAHKLQLLAGDSNSAIDAIEVKGNEYNLTFKSQLSYDTLPKVLSASFMDFNIEEDYRVLVRNCWQENILLGYTKQSLQKNEVACIDREYKEPCSIISVVFKEQKDKNMNLLLVIPAFLLFGLSSLALYRLIKPKAIQEKEVAETNLGNFLFEHDNQKLTIGKEEISLTFRESKLLSYLLINKNQVINRETILENVWGDEGVMVGRSLDVFISRLRKKLAADSNVQIKNIHGVGYKLITP